MTLPNFLVIGAAKAGTTSLYHYLRQHPDVYMSPVKEPRYYSREATPRQQRTLRRAYERLFDAVRSERAIGEASPQYLPSTAAPARIAAALPGVRLIVSLRNPADRAYSSYLGRLRGARESRGIEEAMRPGTYYVETSRYAPALARYYREFARDQIKVMLYEDLSADVHGLMRELFRFLEVDPTFVPDLRVRHNPAMVPRWPRANAVLLGAVTVARNVLPERLTGTGLAGRVQRSLLRKPDPLPPEVRRRLLVEFRDDIRETEALIGRSLEHWHREPSGA